MILFDFFKSYLSFKAPDKVLLDLEVVMSHLDVVYPRCLNMGTWLNVTQNDGRNPIHSSTYPGGTTTSYRVLGGLVQPCVSKFFRC
jgi:hypothetical protein